MEGYGHSYAGKTDALMLRFLDPSVYDSIQTLYRVYDESFLPWAYRRANPNGRPLHDDWAIFKSTPRMETAYRIPLPFRLVSGECEKRWMLWDMNYPASPGLQIEDRDVWDGVKTQRLPHALIDCAVEGSGLSCFSAWIGGEWVQVFKSYRKRVFGRLLAAYTGGLKQDLTVSFDENYNIKSDLMGWWDPPSLSWT